MRFSDVVAVVIELPERRYGGMSILKLSIVVSIVNEISCLGAEVIPISHCIKCDSHLEVDIPGWRVTYSDNFLYARGIDGLFVNLESCNSELRETFSQIVIAISVYRPDSERAP